MTRQGWVGLGVCVGAAVDLMLSQHAPLWELAVILLGGWQAGCAAGAVLRRRQVR